MYKTFGGILSLGALRIAGNVQKTGEEFEVSGPNYLLLGDRLPFRRINLLKPRALYSSIPDAQRLAAP